MRLRQNNLPKSTILYLGFTVLLYCPAFAAAITNLDSKSHAIEINNSEITINAGETWRIPGKVDLIYQDRKIHMDDTEEYAIWNDHEFGPQRRTHVGTIISDR